MADESNKDATGAEQPVEQTQDEGQAETTSADVTNAAEKPGDGEAAAEQTQEQSEEQPVIEVTESTEEGGTSGEATEGEEEKQEVAPQDSESKEADEDDNGPIPENEGVPEEDTTPAVEVAQPMSREGSPTIEAETTVPTEGPDASVTPPPATQSPEPEEDSSPRYDDHELQYEGDTMYEEEEEYYQDSEPEEPLYNRQELMEKYHQALEERSSLQSLNAQLQHKLAEYFKKKKSDERQQEIEKSVTDQEQRYLKYMSNLEELQNEERREKENYKIQIEDLKSRCQEKELAVEDSSAQFSKFKLEVAKQAINSRSGKPISPKDIEQYQALEAKKELEVTGVRLENIKLRNRLKKREMQLKAKEELAEGLHLIDFEQLKIENQTYNEKIEERNEELLKLRKKITTTVQVLTHLKEKLQFVQAENGDQRTKLHSVEALAAQKRDILTRTKQVRDALRIENVKLRQKCGLLGNEPLLRDYELRKEQSDDLSAAIEQLKMDHAELTMNCAGVRQKIDEAQQEK